jgi:hypothetical protein
VQLFSADLASTGATGVTDATGTTSVTTTTNASSARNGTGAATACTDLDDGGAMWSEMAELYGSPLACMIVANRVFVATYGLVPDSVAGNTSTYEGGLLVYECGRKDCRQSRPMSSLRNWTYHLAPFPGPVAFNPGPPAVAYDPPSTLTLLTGYAGGGYTEFNFVTDQWYCGPQADPSAARCEQIGSTAGNRYIPWRLLNYLHAVREIERPVDGEHVGCVVLPWA